MGGGIVHFVMILIAVIPLLIIAAPVIITGERPMFTQLWLNLITNKRG
jgi:hypothetical protein